MGVAIISVEDEAAQASREFRCEIKLLMQHMQLLAADLSHEEGAPTAGHDVQIRVKCDIATFAWLMAHVKAEGGSSGSSPSSHKKPQLDTSNALQLLLAAHYLQMPAVLRSCVSLIATNLLELVPSAAVQLCSLDTALLDKLAEAVQEETLEALHAHCQHHQQQQQHPQHQQQPSRTSTAEPKRQHTSGTHSNSQQRGTNNIPSASSSAAAAAAAVVEKLYKHKLGCLLQQHGSTLLRCHACGQLFASCNHAKLQCPAASATAASSSRQRKLLLHEADTAWSLQAFLAQQRARVKPDKRQQQQVQVDPQQQQQQLMLGACQPLAPSQSPSQHHHQQQLCAQDQGLLAANTQQQNQQQQHVDGAGMSWRQLYWLTWGHVVVLYCQCCCTHFPARLLHECRYHPLPAVFQSDVEVGQYPCCGATAWQPQTYTTAHPGSAAAAGGGGARSGGSSYSSGNNSSPCCSRDHDPYVPAACGSSDEGDKGGFGGTGGSSGLQQGSSGGGSGGSDSPAALKRRQKQQQRVSAARAVQLLQLFAHIITAAPAAGACGEAQQQQHGAEPAHTSTPSPAAAVGCSSESCAEARPASQQRPHTQQQHQQHITLPLLVKMVNRGAAGGRAVGAAQCGGSNSSSRRFSVSPLPALISPRGQQLGGTTAAAAAHRHHHFQRQQQEFNLPAAVDAAAASVATAAHGRRSADTSSSDGSDSDGGSSSRDSSSSSSTASSSEGSIEGSSKHNPAATPRQGGGGGVLQQSEPEGAEAGGCGSDNSDGDDDDEFSLCSGAAHSTPLSSMMGAVRTAAGARSKGLLGFSSSGSSSSAGLMAAGGGAGGLGRVGAPLAETFSAGGRRVLSRPAANRQQPVAARPTTAAAAAASAAPDSRPSTAASLLSLKQQHQLQWQSDAAAGFSRPGATGGSSRLGTPSSGANRPHATTPPAASVAHSNGSDAGALSNIGTAFNRTLLLEMVQLDDAHRMGVLMRKLDSLRLQPPPDAVAVVASRTAGGGGGGQKKKQHHQRKRGQGGDGLQLQQQPQTLTQLDVMQAINSRLWTPPA